MMKTEIQENVKEIKWVGPTCEYKDLIFVSYRTSTVVTDIHTLYMEKDSGLTIDFYSPTITQYHYSEGIKPSVEEKLKETLLTSTDFMNCNDEKCNFFNEQMIDVYKAFKVSKKHSKINAIIEQQGYTKMSFLYPMETEWGKVIYHSALNNKNEKVRIIVEETSTEIRIFERSISEEQLTPIGGFSISN